MKHIGIIVALTLGVSLSTKAQNVLFSINFATPITISKTFDLFAGTVGQSSFKATNKSVRNKSNIRTVVIETADFKLDFQSNYVHSISLPGEPVAIYYHGYLMEICEFSLKYGAVHRHEYGMYSSQDIFIFAKVRIGPLVPPGRYLAAKPINVVVNYN